MPKPNELVTYAEARKMLAERLDATAGEFAVWVVLCVGLTIYKKTPDPKEDPYDPYSAVVEGYEPEQWAIRGLKTYTEHGERFRVDNDVTRVTHAFFDSDEVARYKPEQWFGRFLSFDQVVARWRPSGLPDNEIEDIVVGLNNEAREKEIREFADPLGQDAGRCPPGTLFAFDPFGIDTRFWRSDVRTAFFQEWQVADIECRQRLGLPQAAKLQARQLEPLLQEIERRDTQLQRSAMPGIKDEFQEFLLRFATAADNCALRQLASLTPRQLTEVLSFASCKFKRGSRRGKEPYWPAKFPEVFES